MPTARALTLAASVTLPVRDLHRAVAFYTEALGLSLRLLVGREWAEVQGPGLTIGLDPGAPPPLPADGTTIALEVADLDAAIPRLERAGVRFAPGVVEDGRARRRHFADPDGNRLCLTEPRRLLAYAVGR